jgi:hypothetical protein
MSVNGTDGTGVARPWSVLAWHDWDGTDELVSTLSEALCRLDGVDDVVLYEYVDAEMVAGSLAPGSDGRRLKQITFECEDHEVRIRRDGTIAARQV